MVKLYNLNVARVGTEDAIQSSRMRRRESIHVHMGGVGVICF
jgi:hypothetical protein